MAKTAAGYYAAGNEFAGIEMGVPEIHGSEMRV